MFRLHRLRFHFSAAQPVHFPPGKAANVIRGALGHAFRRVACSPSCKGAVGCKTAIDCAYARIFEPHALGEHPSGLADPPRPFVLRAAGLDGLHVAPGVGFSFGVNLLWPDPRAIAHFVLALNDVAREGLGPGRGVVSLQRAVTLDAAGEVAGTVYEVAGTVYDDGRMRDGVAPKPVSISLEGEPGVRQIRVGFVTPTEVKSEGGSPGPEFGVLLARLRDRISNLKALYQDGPLDIDFRAMGERAQRVRIVGSRLVRVETERRSGRTGQVHPLGGFVGEADYEGELGEFMGFLRVGELVGVGRQTVWGKGEIRVRTY